MMSPRDLHSPLISVIVTAYNYAHTLAMTLDSLCSQDYPNLEILVLDNASSDQTAELISGYLKDPRIRYIRNPVNIGMIPNHNVGLNEAHGAYTMFLAADNILMPGALSRGQEALARNPEGELVYSGLYLMSCTGHIMHRRHNELPARYVTGRDELPILLGYGCDMQIEAMLVSRDLWLRYGLLDESLIAADYEILLRWAAKRVKVTYLPDPFIAFRIHVDQQSSVKNYIATGKQLDEYLLLLNTYLQPGYDHRLRGFEHAISGNLLHTIEMAEQYNPGTSASYTSRILETRHALSEMFYRNTIKPFVPRLSIIILASDSLYALEQSLLSLLKQSMQMWEAIVVQQPGTSLEPFCQRIAPGDRIRVISLIESVAESVALNTGIVLASGNCFAFLRAGSTFPPTHLADLEAIFTQNKNKLIGSHCSLTLTDQTLEHFISTEAFPKFKMLEELLVAPLLPLECIAFRRELLDEFRSFHLDYSSHSHWELLTRLAYKHPLTLIPSMVELHSVLSYDDPLITDSSIIASTKKFYTSYPSPHLFLAEMRQAYLIGLRSLVQKTSTATHSPATRLLEYQTISGKNILEAHWNKSAKMALA